MLKSGGKYGVAMPQGHGKNALFIKKVREY